MGKRLMHRFTSSLLLAHNALNVAHNALSFCQRALSSYRRPVGWSAGCSAGCRLKNPNKSLPSSVDSPAAASHPRA